MKILGMSDKGYIVDLSIAEYYEIADVDDRTDLPKQGTEVRVRGGMPPEEEALSPRQDADTVQ